MNNTECTVHWEHEKPFSSLLRSHPGITNSTRGVVAQFTSLIQSRAKSGLMRRSVRRDWFVPDRLPKTFGGQSRWDRFVPDRLPRTVGGRSTNRLVDSTEFCVAAVLFTTSGKIFRRCLLKCLKFLAWQLIWARFLLSGNFDIIQFRSCLPNTDRLQFLSFRNINQNFLISTR